jgi:hypothetical protein
MAYYIFLKSLRSLEEFRKNPHVKIPPKSPSTNFQSLGKFKNPIFNSEIIFLSFSFANLAAHLAYGPASPPAAPSPAGQNRPDRPIQPAHRSRLHGKYIFLFGSRLPVQTASPSSLCQPSPICQMCLPHHTGRPQPLSSVPSGHPAPPDLRPRDARQDNYPAP